MTMRSHIPLKSTKCTRGKKSKDVHSAMMLTAFHRPRVHILKAYFSFGLCRLPLNRYVNLLLLNNLYGIPSAILPVEVVGSGRASRYRLDCVLQDGCHS